jgi:DNA-binding MarR family transcriptional regulator
VDLATSIGISPAQMSGLVERLHKRGLVAMHRLARDRRRQLCRTSLAGHSLLAQAAQHLDELATSIGRGLTSQEQQQALALCERLSETTAARRNGKEAA